MALAAEKITSFLSDTKRMLIGGEWFESISGDAFPVYNPATGEEIARVYEAANREFTQRVTCPIVECSPESFANHRRRESSGRWQSIFQFPTPAGIRVAPSVEHRTESVEHFTDGPPPELLARVA